MSDTATRNGPWLGMFVAGESNPGGRKHMEDYISLKSETESKGQAFFAIFDGHGGKEAAKFARDNLWEAIKDNDGFDSDDPIKVAKAIAAGFVNTHEEMWKVRGEPFFVANTARAKCKITQAGNFGGKV